MTSEGQNSPPASSPGNPSSPDQAPIPQQHSSVPSNPEQSHSQPTSSTNGQPASTPSNPLSTFLQSHPSIQFIRFHWLDLSSILRTRIIPKKRALSIASGNDAISLAQNCMIIPILPSPRCFPCGPESWVLHADWNSLRICGHHPSHAQVLCFISRRGIPDNERFSRCPRSLLSSVLQKVPKEWDVKIGFELEFNLLNPDYTIYNPLDSLIGYSMLSGLRSNTLTILEEIITSLQTSGIEVWHLHTELPHQLEISLSPGSPMESIDSLLYSMETIRTCFLRHNILVTFFPRPSLSPSGPQNGLHLHLSLSSQESPEYQEILQTIVHTALNKMKALSAIGMANTESYVRAKPDSAGAWIGYGTENRDLPIRKISESRYELRMLDCSSNFYLFVAVVLSMGLGCLDTLEDIGIDAAGEKDLTTTTGEKQQSESSTEQSTQDHLHPQSSPHPQSQQNKFQDCPLKAPTEGNANLRTYGITEKMPKSLQETIEAFNNDKEIESWIGRELHGQYVKIKGHEIDYARDMSDDERRLKFLQFF